jgi:carbonic anhydrase
MADTFTPNADQLVTDNADYVEQFSDQDLPAAPGRNLAVVACMDARLDVSRVLGLRNGDAHVIRNAGGVVTDDVIRSLTLSQRALGTREIVLVHHTRCGLQGVDEEGFRRELAAEVGITPSWSLEGFDDVEEDVRQSMHRLRMSPFLPHKDHIRGFVYEVETGRVREVLDDGGR